MNTSNTPLYQVASFGEILWDLLPSGAQPGGAPMNVAYHLGKLGMNAALISKVGEDDRGMELMNVLRGKKVNAAYVQTAENMPTGVVHAQSNEFGDMEYDIVSPAAWDYIGSDTRTQELVQNTDYFVFGSLSSRNEISRNTLFSLLEMARKKVLDINLRAPFFNRSLVEALLLKTDVLKMNEAELELISGWFHHHLSLQERIGFIQDRFHIPSVMVTLGSNGAIINKEGNFYRHPGYQVKVADTVGSGDSFLAAVLYKTVEGAPVEEALSFASALGALVASKAGGCPEYTVSDIHSLRLQANAHNPGS